MRKLRSLKHCFTDQEYNQVRPTGSRPGILYGLGKVHKTGCPLRPILSAIGTPAYNLAKWLVPILDPVTRSEYTVRDSFAFATEIRTLPPEPLYMASFDIKSLFTNIPLTEAIKICCDELFSRPKDVQPANVTKDELHDLLNAAVRDTRFIFDGKWYFQSDGVAMGSPLGPTLANAFMSYHEKKWLDDCKEEFKPVFYRRYVDDCFLLFKDASHVAKFLEYMNDKHPNIEFTCEMEENGTLPFLDLSLCRDNQGRITTSIYRKPTFSGVYTHFDSFMPNAYKYSLFYTLLYRIKRLCSTDALFRAEIPVLKNIFSLNGYCSGFLNSCVQKFLSRVHSTREKVATVPCKEVYLVLPYLGVLSHSLKRRITKLCERMLPQTKCHVIFKSSYRIRSMFLFKDKVPLALRSHIVYKYTCGGCSATYIGKSVRHLRTRISEHLGVSPRTLQPVSNHDQSAVSDHHRTCAHNYKPCFENFTVIGNATYDEELRIKEALFIIRDKPELNTQGTKYGFRENLLLFD